MGPLKSIAYTMSLLRVLDYGKQISTGTCPWTPKKGLAVETERVPRVETENVNLWTQDIFVFVCDKFVSWI